MAEAIAKVTNFHLQACSHDSYYQSAEMNSKEINDEEEVAMEMTIRFRAKSGLYKSHPLFAPSFDPLPYSNKLPTTQVTIVRDKGVRGLLEAMKVVIIYGRFN